jgi:hypothetical protein
MELSRSFLAAPARITDLSSFALAYFVAVSFPAVLGCSCRHFLACRGFSGDRPTEILDRHRDLAALLQAVYEEAWVVARPRR